MQGSGCHAGDPEMATQTWEQGLQGPCSGCAQCWEATPSARRALTCGSLLRLSPWSLLFLHQARVPFLPGSHSTLFPLKPELRETRAALCHRVCGPGSLSVCRGRGPSASVTPSAVLPGTGRPTQPAAYTRSTIASLSALRPSASVSPDEPACWTVLLISLPEGLGVSELEDLWGSLVWRGDYSQGGHPRCPGNKQITG